MLHEGIRVNGLRARRSHQLGEQGSRGAACNQRRL